MTELDYVVVLAGGLSPERDISLRSGSQLRDALSEAGVQVVVADAGAAWGRALVGSQNFSTASLDRNRELGLWITDPAGLATLAGVLDRDHASGAPWTART